MAIKRGVSLYSYQTLLYTHRIDIEGCMREIQKLGAHGLQMLGEETPLRRNYPRLYRQDIAWWQDKCQKYEIVPTCLDAEVYPQLYKNRYLTNYEQVERIEYDLKYAQALGFSCIRVLCTVPPEIIEAALPLAEYYGVKMGLEIHAPLSIKGTAVTRFLEMAERTGSPWLGLIPDFGIFCKGVNGAAMHADKMMGVDAGMLDRIQEGYKSGADMQALERELIAQGADAAVLKYFDRERFQLRYQDPALLRDIAPYIIHFHGKCWRMNEQCEEVSIDYAGPLAVLRELDWDGYICTEFEGQRFYHSQACPYEEDEIEQVRRHHELLRRLIGE